MSIEDERDEFWRALDGRIKAMEGDLLALDSRVDAIDGGQLEILRQLGENTKVTQGVSAGTSELIEFFQAMKGAFKVMGWIGALAKPMGAIVALFGSGVLAWTAFKGWLAK